MATVFLPSGGELWWLIDGPDLGHVIPQAHSISNAQWFYHATVVGSLGTKHALILIFMDLSQLCSFLLCSWLC